MTFNEILTQVLEQLRREGRVSYRALKRQFALDDEYLEDLKAEIIDAKRLALDEDGKVLVWVGDITVASSQFSVASSSLPPTPQTPDSGLRTADLRLSTPAPSTQPPDARREAERRQMTVKFIDLVGSTALSEQLDPEEYREVVRRYQERCAAVISRYEGHIAQYLGDGVLVYFSYPVAHEDDAVRAVRAGLEIVEAIKGLGAGVGEQENRQPLNARLSQPLQVRIGIHTGLVVVGEIGAGEKREELALGETPNIAARLQGLAAPDAVVLSAATYRLVAGLFECQELGLQAVKGLSIPLSVYRVIRESEAHSRFEVAVRRGLTPLVGRDHEVGLLQEQWERAKHGQGQVVQLRGEAGIGKSRLVQVVKEQVEHEGAIRIEFRCSPYYQNTAWYPVIEHLQRVLQFQRDDAPQTRLQKLVTTLSPYRFPQADTVSLLAALLSLPHPEGYPPLTLSPQKQKQKIQEVLVAWLLEEAEKTAVYNAWEDLHWADPSTLELLPLFIEQVPTARMLTLLTFRPEFTPPWRPRSHITELTLSRLGRPQVEVMVEKVTGGKILPAEVVQQIVAKTDGVPLFVEELTKMVVESGPYVGATQASPLPPLAIPATLHDALMARLDRLAPVREIAQLGATLGREFSYELLHTVSPLDESSLQQALAKLVEAEVLYQRGLPPQARYLFKHALIQDAAYQSLLKSKRQQVHQQIAKVLEGQFPNTVETQPELVAHHYTEAGLIEQAIPYWQQAGQRASQRSANVEAVSHLTKGLELLKTLPDIPERSQQELALQTALGPVLIATKGYTAPEVEHAYTRALELCRQIGETPQLFPVLRGLQIFYLVRAEHKTARELGEQLLTLAQRVQDPVFLSGAHSVLGQTLYFLGELASAREHLEQGIALYGLQQYRSLAWAGAHPGAQCLGYTAWTLWHLGYPEQALKRNHEVLALAQELSHPFSLAYALASAAWLHQYRREGQSSQERAEAIIALSVEQGFPFWSALGTIVRGWALAEQGQAEEGIGQMRQGLAALRVTGAEMFRPWFLTLLAEAYGKEGQTEEGLNALAEALVQVDKTGERYWEAELYRLKGELTLQKFKVQGSKFKVANPQSLTPSTQHLAPNTQAEAEAEACFHKAIEVARKQQAKSLELRATMSLVRLRQQQATQHVSRTTQHEARAMLDAARNTLSEIYNWFTEGFDTKDLQEAKALLEELSH